MFALFFLLNQALAFDPVILVSHKEKTVESVGRIQQRLEGLDAYGKNRVVLTDTHYVPPFAWRPDWHLYAFEYIADDKAHFSQAVTEPEFRKLADDLRSTTDKSFLVWTNPLCLVTVTIGQNRLYESSWRSCPK